MTMQYKASTINRTALPRSKRKRMTSQGAALSTNTTEAGEKWWSGEINPDTEATEVKTIYPIKIVKTLSLTDENGSVVSSIGIDANGRFVFDKGIISKEDIIAYGVSGAEVQSVTAVIEAYLAEHSVGGDGLTAVNITSTGQGNVVSDIAKTLSADGKTLTLTLTKGVTALASMDIADWAKAKAKPSYTTTEIVEGVNKFYTDTRANSAIDAKVTKSYIEGLLTGNVTSHTHSYLPITGGDLSGALSVTGTATLKNGTYGSRLHLSDKTGNGYFELWNQNDQGYLNVGYCDTSHHAYLSVTTDGKIGIGTTTPTSKLHIYQAGYDDGLTLQRSVASGGCSIKIIDGSATPDVLGSLGINGSKQFEVKLGTTQKMVLTSTGLGIGVASPTTKLDVNGSIKAGSTTATAPIGITSVNQNGSVSLYASTNRGLYDNTNSKWLIDYNNTNARTELNDGNVYVANNLNVALGATIGNTSAGVLNVKRTNASGGAFIQFFAQNQTAKYWQAGSSKTHLFGINYNGSTKFTIDQSGNLTMTGDVTAYSDKRLKSDIKDLEYRGPLSPKEYVKDGKKSIGFIAQEVKELYPELVIGEETEDSYLSLNYGAITAVLAAENKELRSKIEDQQIQIDELKELVKQLINR